MILATGLLGLSDAEHIGILAMLVVVIFFVGYLRGTILAQRGNA